MYVTAGDAAGKAAFRGTAIFTTTQCIFGVSPAFAIDAVLIFEGVCCGHSAGVIFSLSLPMSTCSECEFSAAVRVIGEQF